MKRCGMTMRSREALIMKRSCSRLIARKREIRVLELVEVLVGIREKLGVKDKIYQRTCYSSHA